MLRAVMAVSVDDFIARGVQDDMSWTGKDDKTAFKLLTCVGGIMAAGSTTYDQMPVGLPGRSLTRISREGPGITLGRLFANYPGAWLIGGQTVLLEALEADMVDEVHLCRSPVALGSGIVDRVTPFLASRGERHNLGVPWRKATMTRLGEVKVECWRRGGS